MPTFFQALGKTKANGWLSSLSHFSSFSPFSCCLSVVLIRGITPKIRMLCFVPSKQRYFEPFICLQLTPKRKPPVNGKGRHSIVHTSEVIDLMQIRFIILLQLSADIKTLEERRVIVTVFVIRLLKQRLSAL